MVFVRNFKKNKENPNQGKNISLPTVELVYGDESLGK